MRLNRRAIDDALREPDIALAPLVYSRLEVDAAKGHRSGDRVEGGLADGNADHAANSIAKIWGAGVPPVYETPRAGTRGAVRNSRASEGRDTKARQLELDGRSIVPRIAPPLRRS